MGKFMATENFNGKTKISIKEIGEMVKNKDTEFGLIYKEILILDIGNKISLLNMV